MPCLNLRREDIAAPDTTIAHIAALSSQLEHPSKRGPLGLGLPITVQTAEPFGMDGVIAAVRQHIG
jgi:hypothetical protein